MGMTIDVAMAILCKVNYNGMYYKVKNTSQSKLFSLNNYLYIH